MDRSSPSRSVAKKRHSTLTFATRHNATLNECHYSSPLVCPLKKYCLLAGSTRNCNLLALAPYHLLCQTGSCRAVTRSFNSWTRRYPRQTCGFHHRSIFVSLNLFLTPVNAAKFAAPPRVPTLVRLVPSYPGRLSTRKEGAKLSPNILRRT